LARRPHKPDNTDVLISFFGIAASVLAIAAVAVTATLWPDTSGYLNDAETASALAAKAQALTVGGLAAVASAVCWVGFAIMVLEEKRANPQ
jgi:hypothetical protein